MSSLRNRVGVSTYTTISASVSHTYVIFGRATTADSHENVERSNW